MKLEQKKARFGDRRDGCLVRDADALHAFMPYLMPNRADNEAFINERVDLTAALRFLEKKNEGREDNQYKLFHVIAAALIRTVALRPRLNRFIQGHRMYQRRDITLAFVVKKEFSDASEEALAFIAFDGDTTIDSLHAAVLREVSEQRHGSEPDNSTKGMELLTRFPRFALRIILKILRILDYYGRVPLSLVKTDPNYASLFVSNLGSIQLNAAYHHLNNWGTNSLFVTIGEKHAAPYYDEDGKIEMRPALNLGLTLDERIADGYYYSGSIRLLKHLLANPEQLELPAKEEIEL